MLNGSAFRSPLPSAAYDAQVLGMNCIGPTARSKVVSPSNTPWSVSRIVAKPGRPSSGLPRIFGFEVPSWSSCAPANRPWLDSTRPMAATRYHLMWQPGTALAIRCSAFRYAVSATTGMPLAANSGAYAAAGACGTRGFGRGLPALVRQSGCASNAGGVRSAGRPVRPSAGSPGNVAAASTAADATCGDASAVPAVTRTTADNAAVSGSDRCRGTTRHRSPGFRHSHPKGGTGARKGLERCTHEYRTAGLQAPFPRAVAVTPGG